MCRWVYTHAHKFDIRFIWLFMKLYFTVIGNKVIIAPKEERGLLLWSFWQPQLLLKMCQTGDSHGASLDCVESRFHGPVKAALLYRKCVWSNKSQAVLPHNVNSPRCYLEAVFWPGREIEIKLHIAHIDKTTKTLSSESNCARWENPT